MGHDLDTLDFRPIKLEDKELFNKYITKYNCNNSEASFANLYIWQPAWNIKMATVGGAMIISMYSDDYRLFLCPPFLADRNESIAPYMEMCGEYMLKECGDVLIKGATGEIKEKIEADCPGRYAFKYDEYNSEYVYNAKDLIELAGKKYHSKRNHINVFLRNYDPVLEEYTPKYRDECINIQKKWAKERQDNEREAREELESITRALDNYEALDMRGCVVLLGGEVAAFSFGERVCPKTAVIHIEKADNNINGLYTYINREFVANFWNDCEYINREEDMGVPGIRQAKRSYHPVYMIDKYDVTLK